MLEQISIWDILQEKEDKVPEGWERIPDSAEVTAIEDVRDYDGDKNNPFMIYPDKIAKGRINRTPCIIGYLTGVSGPGECFETLVPKFFKRTTIAPCPLKDYCLNNPAGCAGRTWWCARTKKEVEK